MRKTFALILFATLLLAGCTKQYVTEETIIQGSTMTFVDFTVKSNQWQLDDVSGFFMAWLSVPEITQDVLDKGAIGVSRRLWDNSGQTYWTPLPIVRAEQDVVDGSDYLFSTYIDYEWTVGNVYIYVTATDFYTGDVPEEMSFRVTIIQ